MILLILNFILYLRNFQLLHFYTNRAYNNFNNTFVVKCFWVYNVLYYNINTYTNCVFIHFKHSSSHFSSPNKVRVSYDAGFTMTSNI